MKEVTRTLAVTRRVTINVEENDLLDIRCGGPAYLGYDFYVDADQTSKEVTQFLETVFKELNRSYRSLYVSEGTYEVNKDHVWTFEKMKDYITKNKDL